MVDSPLEFDSVSGILFAFLNKLTANAETGEPYFVCIFGNQIGLGSWIWKVEFENQQVLEANSETN